MVLITLNTEKDPDKGLNDPDVKRLIEEARLALCQYANSDWVKLYPMIFSGMEESFKLLAQAEEQVRPSSTTLSPSPSSTLGGTETAVDSSRVSKQNNPLPAIQQAPAHDPAAPAPEKSSPMQVDSPNALPSKTQPVAPLTSSATPSRTASKTPAPRPVTRSGSSAFPSQPHHTAPTASANVKTPSAMRTDVEEKPPPTLAIVTVCFIQFTKRILTSFSSENWSCDTWFDEASQVACLDASTNHRNPNRCIAGKFSEGT